MAEEPASEKHFDATPKRLEDLRKKGDVLRAKDFTGGMTLLLTFCLMLLMSNHVAGVLKHNFEAVLKNFDPNILGEVSIGNTIQELAFDNLILFLPLGIGTLFIAVFSTYLLGGKLSFVLKFKGERLNPLANLKRMFAPNKVFELIKSVLKVLLFAVFLGLFIYLHELEIITLSSVRDSHALMHAFVLLEDFIKFMFPPIILLAAFDAIYNFFSYRKKTRMTLQEIKDERKDTDGDPDIKGRRRAIQRELALRDVQRVVPLSTVVVTNPTHFAVALKYDDEDKAPKVVAKGVDFMAQEIKLIALKNMIPIYEAPLLARAIYYTGKVGSYIHKDLYRSVAMVLAYVMQLKQYQQGIGEPPVKATDLEVPESLQF